MDTGKTKDSFIHELGRRHIVQVALLYFAIAWTATEVLSFLFEAIPVFPAWSKTLVALLFVLGFPVAMFLAWRFDIGPGGIKRTEAATTRGKLTVVVALALLAASTAGLFYLIYPQVQEQASGVAESIFDPPENSIAIMMFLDMGSDPDNEYFSQGVPDTILHKLANLKDLIVVARTSSFALSSSGMDAKMIGRELDVRYLLEGSVQLVDNDVRIISQLIDTTDATHVWSLDQRLVLDDFFAVQDEIALEITRALRLSLRDEERERLLANGTTSVPAYLAYLRGNYASQSRSLELLDDAIGHYEEAIELDPNFARAYVGIGRSYELKGRYGAIDRAEGDALHLQYLEKAIELDDQLGEAYAALAFMRNNFAPDKELIRKALSLNPNDANVLRSHARSLCEGHSDTSCLEESFAIQLEAIRRSPENANLYFDAAFMLMSLGRLDEVSGYFAEAVRRNPAMTSAYTRLGRWNMEFGNDAIRGVACLKKAIAIDPENAFPKTELASAYIDLGLDDLAEEVLANTRDPHGAWDGIIPFVRLKLHVYRNENGEALEIAKRNYRRIGRGTQAVITMDVLIDEAGRNGDFAQIIEHLESIIGHGEKSIDYANVHIDSPDSMSAAIPLVRVHNLLGDSDRANAVITASIAFLQRQLAATPNWRPALADKLAQARLWQGELGKALDELETIPGAHMRHAWYLERAPAYEVLRDHPRFKSIVERVDSWTAESRERLEAFGDDLPPCVANMRTMIR